jgi:hypothetical protein
LFLLVCFGFFWFVLVFLEAFCHYEEHIFKLWGLFPSLNQSFWAESRKSSPRHEAILGRSRGPSMSRLSTLGGVQEKKPCLWESGEEGTVKEVALLLPSLLETGDLYNKHPGHIHRHDGYSLSYISACSRRLITTDKRGRRSRS